MQNSAPNQQLPEAHIIASANDASHNKLFIVIGIVFVIVFLAGIGGIVAYTAYQKNALEAKLLQAIQSAPPVPTVGIPSATKAPTPTKIPPTPTLILVASPSAITTPSALATPSATPYVMY